MNAPAKIEASTLASAMALAVPDVSNVMRSERIISIHRDPLLDRFSVTLADYTMGLGATVGDALADAQRRAA